MIARHFAERTETAQSGRRTSGRICDPIFSSSGGAAVAMSLTYVVRTPTVRFT